MDPVVHFEMPYEDRERMAEFYEKVFGWRTRMMGEEMGDYVLATTSESHVESGRAAGATDGGFYPRKPDWPAQHPSIVIAVDDIDGSASDVRDAGGEVLGEPMTISGIGR